MAQLNFPASPAPGDQYIVPDTGEKYEWTGYAWDFIESVSSTFPRGLIMMWSGADADIPGGWLLCDGTLGTPDLRGKFIMGGQELPVVPEVTGTEGGSNLKKIATNQLPGHTHPATSTVNDPGHDHTYYHQQGGEPYITGHQYLDRDGTSRTSRSTTGITVSTTVQENTGGQDFDVRPAYYVLSFIMKA